MRKDTFRRILHYLKPYRSKVLLSVLCAVVCVAMTLYVPILIGQAVDRIVYKNVDFPGLMSILLKAGIAALLAGLSQWYMNLLNNRTAFGVVLDIRNDAFAKLMKLPLSFLDSHAHGDIVSSMIADADQFSDGLLMGFTQLFTGVITILGTLGFMLYMNPGITLIVVLVTPLSLFAARFISSRTYSMFVRQSEIRGKQTAFINEMLMNVKVIKAFCHEKEAEEEFDAMNEELSEASRNAVFYSSLTNPVTRFVNAVMYALVALFGALRVLSGSMTVGVLTCFLSYANQYTKPFNEITGVITELQNALACAARIFALIDEEAESSDQGFAELGRAKEPESASAYGIAEKSSETAPGGTLEKEMTASADGILKQRADSGDIQGEILISGVDFSYNKDKRLIENLNVSVKPGERVAIVGPTGSGKTTIINLLMRFYDVDHGEIRIDGRRIDEVTRKSLRGSFGMVLQETWLRNGTIADNIRMGKPDATREEIIQAAKETYAHSFIRRLPEGYDTRIGEEVGELSQGQKQLLCITRIMLSLPPMLILDEATSSIDTRTELRIQSAFQKMMQGRTSFIVAHRLSTIKTADTILVMKDGHVIEQGNHRELLAAEGFYAKLYNSQFEGQD
ncbi:MAG: ABC transporter ATP-binding protein [Lachnospiraceae bacterium]|nr:ABC transporter ATP-binding protein [Lachnospiraceae bacterium]